MGEFVDNHPIVLFSVGVALLGIGIWVGKINSDRSTFKDFIKEVRGKLDQIIFHLIPDTVVSSTSPTRLTELGVKISKIIDARYIAEQLAMKLQEDVKDRTPYEIQEFCNSYMINKFEPIPEQFAKLRNCAYQEGIQIESVHRVISIELRDKLLELEGYTVDHLD